MALQLLPLPGSTAFPLTQVLVRRALPEKPVAFQYASESVSEDPNLQRFRIPFLELHLASRGPRLFTLIYSSEG